MVDLPPLGIGSDLGRYRLVRLLGRGGMGEVHLARDNSLDRDVAIKFIAPEKVADADARRRLIREARAAAALDHPGICTVHETGETADGRTYIVMQYVEGRPLTDVLRGGLLPVRDALVLCAGIAEALDAAHGHGIVHRDLKPANVIVTPAGQPKLVDFGLAKVLSTPAEILEAETTTAATTAGIILGTAGYMSPEQAQQRPLDRRSDLFSLGALLFECLTGKRAFEGPTTLETIAKVIHWHPQDPSRVRRELDERHDELCRRLLAKDPADRFQSAQEVVGAIRLLVPDTSRSQVSDDPTARWKRQRRRRRLLVGLAVGAVLTIGAATVWMWPHGALPAAPADAEVWYKRGTDALREGGYFRASMALQRAVAVFPDYPLAYARLAEARAELDDQRAAQESLLRVVVPARLAKPERLRLDAVRSLVLRDVDAAISLYSELTRINPGDAGAWLDLGRAQEAAGLRNDARASYQRAIAIDREYAPAYVRLGYLEALASRRDEALAAFGEAERLYQAAVDVEGQAEVLLRRGGMFDSFNDLKAARADLEHALSLATSVGATYQQVRARLSLSSVSASEGRLVEAASSASAAVQEALKHGLETLAADGLIDLSSVLQSGHLNEAESQAQRAVQLAEGRGAKRTVARGKVQLAAIYEQLGRPQEALDLLASVLPFLKENQYHRFELLGLSVASRAHSALDALDEAQRISSDVLRSAETMKDEGQVALAATNLASVTAALGNYPEALRLRLRAEEIHKRQGDHAALPYDLANRADLLIRLGRAPEADIVLKELEAGIAAKIDSYITRENRALFFRAFAAVTARRCDDARPFLRRLEAFEPTRTLPGVLGPAIALYCDALSGRRASAPSAPADLDPTLARERLYWVAAAGLHRADWPQAHADADAGLALLANKSNDELRWRLAAVGAVAARQMGNGSIVSGLSTTARDALARLQARWQGDFAAYARRPDLADLRKRADQN